MKTFIFNPIAKEEGSERFANYIVERFRHRKISLFFGAGTSRDYPTLNPLVADSNSIPGFRTLLSGLLVEGCPASTKDAIKSSIEKKPLEWILEHYAAVIGNKALDILSLLQSDGHGAVTPNYNHYALALLSVTGFCQFSLTVNFDTLFEQAFQNVKKCSKKKQTPRLIIPEELENEESAYNQALRAPAAGDCYLFKLHGTIKNERSLLTTVETLGFGLPHYKNKLIRSLLRGSTCLFIGYRYGDLDIFPLLDMLPRDVEIIWYEKNEDAKNSELLGSFLARHPHFLITGSLGPILNQLLVHLQINDDCIWSLLPANSFLDLEKLQNKEEEKKARTLRQFVSHFAANNVPNDASHLIAARILSLDYPNAGEIRRQLVDSIDEVKLKSDIRYAYYAELAERNWNVGRLTDAIRLRHLSLRHVRDTRLNSNGKTRVTIEQWLRIARDSLNLFKRSHGFDRFVLFTHAFKNLSRSSLFLLLFRKRLTFSEYGALMVMLMYFPGDFFEWIHEKRTYIRLRRLSDKDQNEIHEEIFSRMTIKLAAFFYRRYEKYLEFSFGWNSHCMRRLGEMYLHGAQSDVPETRSLFADADRPINWVEEDPTRFRGELDQAVKPGLHVALRLLYSGAPEEALQLLQQQYEAYEKTGHLSGKRKTLIYQALCHERMGNIDKVRVSLERIKELLNVYQ